MIPLKRRKITRTESNQDETCTFSHVSIFILERKMGASRRAFLKRLARSKGFLIKEKYSSAVTHVVSENNSGDDVQAWLDNQSGGDTSTSLQLLDISWFTESMEAGRPVTVQDKHRLKVNPKPNGDAKVFTMKSYACQRRTPLKHQNVFLTEALEILAENAEFSKNEGRSVAFTRAASVLKALPHRVYSMDELKCLPCLGEHSQRVIKEILEDGTSREVESTRQSEQFQAMKALTGIFGVGVRTADRWLREGLRSPSDLIQTGQPLNRAQQAGVQYYNDLQKPVTKAEAEVISDIVQEAVHAVLLGAEIQLMGGFKRGKDVGHDVDFLITHPEEGKEEGLIAKIINWLEEKLQRSAESTGSEAERSVNQSETSSWRAVRVDLVVSPYSQFAFATLGWTGSKLFERELRRWAGQEKHMSLSSHALYDSNQKCYLRAQTEEEIFAYLGLEFIPPCERNA
ncbi:DNA-directed DNA/RNA polymerase mu-like isoform X2 [Xyrauchen texanus]|uniref:DNA-directed DNA/RNA polymerase mu-like isoform X2 n=1 Tax=Xyrauchen texanus TaxID=154827 RepID=UPI0022423B07|nr:DNA-directed DNA/RNA polymerase mu-like isoform X2 [Xyrauchen texanus]